MDASLRAVALGAIAVLAVTGLLDPAGYVALLAVSSLLHAWGSAGTYTLVAELLPEQDQVAGNALLSTFNQAAFVVGPALAGGLTALVGPGWVIGVDAASFAVLAVAGWTAPARQRRRRRRRRRPRRRPAAGGPSPASRGCSACSPSPACSSSCTARSRWPCRSTSPSELHGSPGLLGLYWTVFGIGATSAARRGLLRHRRPGSWWWASSSAGAPPCCRSG